MGNYKEEKQKKKDTNYDISRNVSARACAWAL